MEEVIRLLEQEIAVRTGAAEELFAKGEILVASATQMEEAIKLLRAKSPVAKPADPATDTPEPTPPPQPAPRPQETAIKPEPPVERGQSIDLRKGKWSEEKKAAARLTRVGVIQKGACPLSIKGSNLFHAGVYLDDLDQDEKFIMVDLIRDFGFEVLRSMMRGTIKDLDKVVGKLRTVIPRSLEIIDTPTGWKLQAKEG